MERKTFNTNEYMSLTETEIKILKTLNAGNSPAMTEETANEMHRKGLIQWADMMYGWGWQISRTGKDLVSTLPRKADTHFNQMDA